MTKPLTSPDTNIDLSSVIQAVSGRHPATPQPQSVWHRTVALFWSHTEETSGADTSCFKGIL